MIDFRLSDKIIINSGNFWYSSFTSKGIYAANYLKRKSHFDQSLTSVPGKGMEKVILGSTENHLEDNAVF